MTSINDVYGGAARIILANIYKIPNCNITDVAKMCYVSTATISRLCRKLNYESFAEFKNDVIGNIQYFNTDVKRMIYNSQLPEKEDIYEGKEVFKEHFEGVIENLNDTYDSLEYEDVMHIVDQLNKADRICFIGNFFTQTATMQLQIELAYQGKDCLAMYPVQQQKLVIEELGENDLIIISSISGAFFRMQSDIMRQISKSKAHKIVITQKEKFAYSDKMDKILQVGNNQNSLIGKFSIIYIFEILEALYHLKYGTK